MSGKRQVERVAPLPATEIQRFTGRHGFVCGDDCRMGAGHAVFFVEVVGGFAVKFELHLRVVVEHFHAVPLLRVDRPDAAFRGEDVFGGGCTVFREFAEFEPARQHA